MSLALLRSAPLLADLPPAELERLAARARAVDYPPGALLMREGGADDRLWVLAEGEVEIVKELGTADERRLTVCQPGALMGEMSLFTIGGRHTASARALSHVRALALRRADVQALFERQPRLAGALMRLLSQRLDEAEHVTIRDLREKNRALTQANRELAAAQAQIIEKERLEREIEIARDMQRSLLPQGLPKLMDYDLGAMMEPARLVGGDFYDVVSLPGQRLALVVGDVCGKGVPAALFMALSLSLVRAEASRALSPGETLAAVNRHLLAVNHADMFVTLLYVVLDGLTGRLSYARAGHPPLLVMDAAHRLTALPRRQGQMLGLFDEPALDTGELAIEPGSLVLLYSDGLSEAIGPGGDEIELEQIGTLLAESDASAQALCDRLWQAVLRYAPAEGVHDDFTVLALRRVGG